MSKMDFLKTAFETIMWYLTEKREEETDTTLEEFSQSRINVNVKGFNALKWWSLAQVIISIVGLFVTQGFWNFLFQMNLFSNVINLGVALVAINKVQEYRNHSSVFDYLQFYIFLDKVLLLTIGLDLFLLMIAVWMFDRGQLTNNLLMMGYSASGIYNGLFLTALHIWTYYRNDSETHNFIETVVEKELV